MFSIVGWFLFRVARCVGLRMGYQVPGSPAFPQPHCLLWGGSCGGHSPPQVVACACCLPAPPFEQMYIYFYSNGKSN